MSFATYADYLWLFELPSYLQMLIFDQLSNVQLSKPVIKLDYVGHTILCFFVLAIVLLEFLENDICIHWCYELHIFFNLNSLVSKREIWVFFFSDR